MPPPGETLQSETPQRRPLHRWLPILFLVAALALAWALGLNRFLSLATIAENREVLRAFVLDYLLLSLILYALVYILITALLIPGAALLTVLGGFLFGWALAAPVTVVAATLGATILFLSARSSFGGLLIKRGGGLVGRLANGFADDAFSYLLFLRLVPLFPFFVVNIAPALCAVKTRTFVLATLIGIIPATFAYAFLGSGLDQIIRAELISYESCVREGGAGECTMSFNALSLLTPQLIAAFLFLGAMALIPPLLKYRKASKLQQMKHP
jgi:uncharacterized membrane protein YdjX (TVP38/TMEM64 family)